MLDQHTSDNWNPVFWKEMHLMCQNRMLIVMPLIVACLEILCVIGIIYIRVPGADDDLFLGSFSEESLCIMFYIVQGLLSLAWVASQVFLTTSQERNVEGLDPQLGTRLTPFGVLAGKFSAMMVCVTTCQVMALPFFFVAGRLEGRHWLAFLALFALLSAASAWLVMLGCLPKQSATKGMGVSQGVGALALIPMAGSYLFVLSVLCERIRNTANDPSWRACLVVILCAVSVSVFAFCLALSLLRNSRQERSWSWRLAVLAIWAMVPWTCALIFRAEGNTVMATQAHAGFIMAAAVAIFSLFERLEPCRRTLQCEDATGLPWKVLTLPFRSGLGPGLVLAWLLYLVSCAIAMRLPTIDNAWMYLYAWQASSAYMLLYVPLIAIVAEHFHFPREKAGGVVVAVVFFLPVFAGITGLDQLACLSPFYPMMLDEEYYSATAIVVALLAVVPSTIALFQYCSKYFSIKK